MRQQARCAGIVVIVALMTFGVLGSAGEVQAQQCQESVTGAVCESAGEKCSPPTGGICRQATTDAGAKLGCLCSALQGEVGIVVPAPEPTAKPILPMVLIALVVALVTGFGAYRMGSGTKHAAG